MNTIYIVVASNIPVKGFASHEDAIKYIDNEMLLKCRAGAVVTNYHSHQYMYRDETGPHSLSLIQVPFINNQK